MAGYRVGHDGAINTSWVEDGGDLAVSHLLGHGVAMHPTRGGAVFTLHGVEGVLTPLGRRTL